MVCVYCDDMQTSIKIRFVYFLSMKAGRDFVGIIGGRDHADINEPQEMELRVWL